jgi:hypothetical protein
MPFLDKAQLATKLQEVLARLLSASHACAELRSGFVSKSVKFGAYVDAGEVTLSWNLEAIRENLSNHIALRFSQQERLIETAVEEFAGLIHNHMGGLEGRNAPLIDLQWTTLEGGDDLFRLSIDTVTIDPDDLPPDEFCEKLATCLTRHASLPLKGDQVMYRITSSPLSQVRKVDILAPSEALAVARLGVLSGKSAEAIWVDGPQSIVVTRLSAIDEIKSETKQLLAQVGLP